MTGLIYFYPELLYNGLIMWKYKTIIGLGIAIVLLEVLGFTDSIKEYAITVCATLIILLSVWLLSEKHEHDQQHDIN